MNVRIKRVQFREMIMTTWLSDSSLDVERKGGIGFTVDYDREAGEFVIRDTKNADRLAIVVPVSNVASYEPYHEAEEAPVKLKAAK